MNDGLNAETVYNQLKAASVDDRKPAYDLIEGLESEIDNLRSIGKQIQENKGKKVSEDIERQKEQGRRPRTLDFRNEPPLD